MGIGIGIRFCVAQLECDFEYFFGNSNSILGIGIRLASVA